MGRRCTRAFGVKHQAAIVVFGRAAISTVPARSELSSRTLHQAGAWFIFRAVVLRISTKRRAAGDK